MVCYHQYNAKLQMTQMQHICPAALKCALENKKLFITSICYTRDWFHYLCLKFG